MTSPVDDTTIEHRSLADLYDRRILVLIAVVALLLVATMVVQGAAHDTLHDARHVAGVACH